MAFGDDDNDDDDGKDIQFLFRRPCLRFLLRSPFVRSGRSDQSVLKWNSRVLRTGSVQNGPAHGSEPLSYPAPVGQSAGIWRVVAEKLYSLALDLSI